jgi:hypothetical protein
MDVGCVSDVVVALKMEDIFAFETSAKDQVPRVVITPKYDPIRKQMKLFAVDFDTVF